MLSERQNKILKHIVELYVENAEPVSSKILVEECDIQCSSATIRNEMAILEELGHIQKTHTSSGRIPSSKGYRYYVDHIGSENLLAPNDLVMFDELFKKASIQKEEAVKEAVKILSDITNYTSIALGPHAHKSIVKQIQFVSLSQNAAVVILVTDRGHVQTQNIIIPKEVNVDEVERIIKILNEVLLGVIVSDVPEKLENEFKNKIKEFVNYYDLVVDTFLNAFMSFVKEEKFYLGGQNNILAQPEFRDVGKLKKIMDVIEKKEIVKLLEANEGQPKVSIGNENQIVAMDDCSIVSVPYQVGDDNFGSIAILGPMRMDYSRIIPILRYIAKQIEKMYEK